MINKPTIIITSLGRTGTRFFYTLFANVLSNCTALHEPDVLHIFHSRELVKQVKDAGVYSLIIRKALGKPNLIRLSDSRVVGELSRSEIKQEILSQREDFIHSKRGSIYVESNAGYYALVDTLPEVFTHHRAVYIIRDGRGWVRSKMNWGEMYGKGKLRSIFAHTWPTAPEIAEDPYADQWHTMSRFERICWAWTKLNGYALDIVQDNPSARVFRFEDIFKSENRYQHLAELVNFATDMPGVDPVPAEALDGWLDRRIHKSSGDFPAWSEWSTQQKQQFIEICGPLMEELGYELN